MDSDYEEKRPFLINKLETLQKFYKEQSKLEREIKFAFPKFVDADDKDYEDAAQRLINQASAADTFNAVFLNKLKPKYNPARLGDQNPPQENGIIQEDKKPAPVLPKVGSQAPPREERKVEEPIIQRVPGKELKIVITISNPEFYDKVTKIQQDSEGKPVKYDFDLIMKKALLHLRHFVNNGLAENYYKVNKAEQETVLFGLFKAKPHYSGANKDVELLPDGFEYHLLPKSIEIKAYTTDPLDLKDDNMNPKVEVKRGNQALSDYDKQQEPMLLKRFDRFLRYFQGLPYTLLDRNDLKEAVEKTVKKFFGIREFMDKFLIELNQFTSPWFSAPKGILLYGPPGTGKSAITKALCEELGVVFATAPMAAGDLKKGIVGDSEKTINAIAQRAKLIPWEMLVALIDEIDSLAPDRNGQNSSSGSEDLIGVLLATMDGSKETKNLKIIASTNLLNKIDAAFLRRMEIQLFLGNPNKESRKQWIESKAALCYKDPKAYRVKDFLNRADLKDLREKITDTTINFSADSFRKLLDRYYHALLSLDNEPTIKDYTRLLYEKIKGVSQEMKIVLAGTPIIDIFEQTEDLRGMYSPPAIADFHALCAADNHEKVSRKVLVDLSSESPNEIFQIHCGSDKTMTEIQSDIYRELEIVYDDAIDDPDNKALTFYHYLYAILVFKNVKHVAHSPEETQKLNGIRGRLLSFANIDKFEGLRKERVTKLHNALEKYHSIDPKLFELWKSFSANASYMFYNMLNSISAFYSQSDDLKTFSLLEKKNIQMYQKCWLPLILQFSLAYNADITKLIDNNFIVNNNANDDTAAMALVNSVVEETKKYGRAVVIFDLDSIAQLRKEYQSLKEDIKSASLVALQGGDNASSFSYVMQRPLTFNFVLDLIKILNPNGSCWFFAVSNHKKLTLDFKEALKWPQTESEKEYERKEEEKEIPYRCSRCKEIFTERENAFEYKCGRHKESTLVYENPNKDKDKKSQKPEIVDLATAQLMIRVTKDAFPWQFKYTCCGGPYDSKGELPCQHKKGERFNYDE